MDTEKRNMPRFSAQRLRELVRASCGGDMSAFETLFASAEEALYRMGLSITGSEDDAEEALAETALSVLDGIASLRQPEYFYTWATRIMINACYALSRDRSKVVALADVEAAGHGSADYPGDSRWAQDEDLLAALSSLGTEHRTVVVLRYLEDMPVSQVAEITGVPEGTVKSRLHYALQKLRVRMDDARPRTQTGGAARE